MVFSPVPGSLIILLPFFNLWQYSLAEPLKVVEFVSGKTLEIGPLQRFVLQSPNFPLPFEFSEKSAIELKSVPGRGYRFFFREFLLGPDLVLEVCSGSVCRTKTNDEMVHRKDSAYLEVNGQASMFLRPKRTAYKPDGLSNSGFQAIVEDFDLSHPEVSSDDECQRIIELSADDHITFIRSPNYPASFGQTEIGCRYKIHTLGQSGIRVQFFDFRTSNSTKFILLGKVREGQNTKEVTEEFTGYETLFESFPRYFVEEIEITFNIKSNSDEMQRFFIIIDQFDEPEEKVDSCSGLSVTPVANEDNAFMINSNNAPIYAPNMNCFKEFRHSGNSLLALELFDLQTEACCDRLELSGIRTDPTLDDWRVRGAMREKILFAEDTVLGLRFVSDGVGQVKGFSAKISEYDCSCGHLQYALSKDAPNAHLESPGYGSARGYCPGLDCEWTIAFPIEFYLEISLVDAQLRPFETADGKNVVRISNALREPVDQLAEASSNPRWISGGMATVGFASDRKMFYDTKMMSKRGFSLQLNLRQFKSKSDTEVIFLNKRKQTHVIELRGSPPGVLWSHLIFAEVGERIKLFVLEHSDGTLLDIFDGPDIQSPLLFSTSEPQRVDQGPIRPISSSGSNLHIRLYSPEKPTNLILIVSQGGGSDYGCPSPFIYSVSDANGFALNLGQPAPFKQSDHTCQIILFHGSANSDNYEALQLEMVPATVSQKVSVFKGIPESNDQSVLFGHFLNPTFVFGKFISVEYDPKLLGENAQIEIVPIKRSQKGLVSVDADAIVTGNLASPDFPQSGHDPSPSKGLLYVFEHRTDPSAFIQLHLELSHPADPSQLRIRVKVDNEFVSAQQLVKDKDGSWNGEFCAKSVELEYNPNGRFGDGLFGQYALDGTGKCAKAAGSGSLSDGKMFSSTLLGVLSTAILILHFKFLLNIY